MRDATKRAIEKATIKAAAAIAGVVKVFDEHGVDLSADDAAKVFAHLRVSVLNGETRANAARALQLSVTKTFSLENPIDVVVTTPAGIGIIVTPAATVSAAVASPPQVSEPTPAPAAPAPAPPQKAWTKPEGRLAGQEGKIVPIFAPPDVPKVRRTPVEPGEVPDKTGGIKDVGFLEN